MQPQMTWLQGINIKYGLPKYMKWNFFMSNVIGINAFEHEL